MREASIGGPPGITRPRRLVRWSQKLGDALVPLLVRGPILLLALSAAVQRRLQLLLHAFSARAERLLARGGYAVAVCARAVVGVARLVGSLRHPSR